MADMTELFDMHVHLCRDTQQEKLVFPRKGWPDDWYKGSPDRVIPYMDANGISYMATMNVMNTNAMMESRIRRAEAQGASSEEIERARVDLREDMRERMRQMNDWSLAAQAKEPRIIVYIAIDPVLFGETAALEELERCVKLGATGIKVHPSNYQHYPDHPAMMAILKRCEELGLGVLTDTSSRASLDGGHYGAPLGWRPVLQALPHLKFIMAHLCDDMWDDRLDLAREFYDNLWFDFSQGLVDEHHPARGHICMPTTQAERVFRKVGIERIMWASDGTPHPDGLFGAHQIMSLPFSDSEKEAILAGNAKRFFGVK